MARYGVYARFGCVPEDVAPESSLIVSNAAMALARLAEALLPADQVVPEALDASQAAKLCGVGRTKWHDLNTRGLCPSPVELGDRCPRWLRSELLAWLRAGAPPRIRWHNMRDACLRKYA